MPLTPRTRPIAFTARGMRRATPRCRGGASSLLRLAQPISTRLPPSNQLNNWVERAARAFATDPVFAGPADLTPRPS